MQYYAAILAALAASALAAPRPVQSRQNYGINGEILTGPAPVASDYFLNFAVITDTSDTTSSGFNITKIEPPSTVAGFLAPIALFGALNVPLDPVTSQDTYMGDVYYPFGSNSAAGEITSYDPTLCANICAARMTSTNTANPQPVLCNQVVSSLLRNNSAPVGQYCSLYTESWSTAYAVNLGQWRGADWFSVTDAYYYINDTYALSFAPICAASNCPNLSYTGGSCGGYGVGTC